MSKHDDALAKLIDPGKLAKIREKKEKVAKGDHCCDTVAEMYVQLAAVTAYCLQLESWISSTLGGGGGRPPPPPPEWP